MAGNRLLIIDDEPAIGAFVSRVAANIGYEIMAISTADKFLEHVRNWRPTHIMMDLQMPVVDGLALLSNLAAEKCEASIILISGADRTVVEAARRIAIERGLDVTGALTKPIRVADLTAALNAAKREEPWLTVAGLSNALEHAEFHLRYQPKVALGSGEITGAEALIRWQHGVRGMIPPLEFIPFAESSAFIDQLTHWVSGAAFEQVRAWGGAGVALDIALNISARNLHEPRFADLLEAQCRSADVAPARVTLELTETAAMQDAVQMMDVLTRLRLKGFKLAIDDFGTGYSSLVQLHRLPFSEIKVDRTFVTDCTSSAESRSIVRVVIDLAHALGMKAVAEGVESVEALDLLRELGCDQAQGYFIARPIAAGDVPDAMLKHKQGDWFRSLQAWSAPPEGTAHRA
ncbi:MAG TPA: EAL domain-containing response regulator [Dongiaceae bacterium]|jgi:EAL domain-containing protein (putative c-di-GMP-specific phosphodiesterase class I)|nr:EAL domain-containing response regulator [Dongiaceae bacterium]